MPILNYGQVEVEHQAADHRGQEEEIKQGWGWECGEIRQASGGGLLNDRQASGGDGRQEQKNIGLAGIVRVKTCVVIVPTNSF